MTATRSGVVARTGAAGVSRLTVVAILIALVAAIANAADFLMLAYFGPLIVLPLVLGTFAGVGLIVALRRPGRPIGWLFLGAGALFAVDMAARAYAWQAFAAPLGSLPGREVATWLSSFLSFPALGAILVALVLFPTDRLPSRRWAPILLAIVVMSTATTLARALAPRPLRVPYALTASPAERLEVATIPNPFGIGGAAGDAILTLLPLTDAFALPSFLLALLALLARFARSTGTERLQLKWFAYAASVSLGSAVSSVALPKGTASDIAWALSLLSSGFIPIAIGIAVLRYRLYDIDVLIRRTLIYAAVSLTLAATYFAGVVLLQTVLRPLIGGSEVPVALSTLAVVALFAPLRRRIQQVVDRRFYRSRYDAAHTLDAFGARLRDEVDLEAVRGDLPEAVHETVRPAHASVWLREPTR